MTIADMVAEALLSARSEAVIAADTNGTIILWNPGAERMFGYPAASAIGASLNIIIPQRLRQRHWEGYRRVMHGDASRYGDGRILAVPGMTKDGSRLSLEFAMVLLRDEAGQVAGIAAVLRDVTARFDELQSLRQKLAMEAGSV
jgi:PAS domain S-box-containing protein